MTNNTTIIGVLCETYDRTFLCSVAELYEATHSKQFQYTAYFSANQYCDFRYATNLQRFRYDPFTGEKIDWKKVKELIK